MNVAKLNLGMVRAEKVRAVKQKQALAQEARLQSYVTKVARKILSDAGIENNVRICKVKSEPTITEYICNLRSLASASENIWAPWSKSFK